MPMEIEETIRIMRALADGTNPETGETLEANSIYRNPRIAAALNRSLGVLQYMDEREKAKRSRPANAGKPWSGSEEAQVCDELRQGLDFHHIAKLHNRTVASIVARLVKMGKISSRSNTPKFPPRVA
jgi:hypothetical protein